MVRALTYLLSIGREGVPEAAKHAVLNANYMRVKLADVFPMAYDRICMHEFVMTLEKLKEETGVSALDVAKAMLDYGIHPPTMYFPLIVHEALMVEPTETETRETLDEVIGALRDARTPSFCRAFRMICVCPGMSSSARGTQNETFRLPRS